MNFPRARAVIATRVVSFAWGSKTRVYLKECSGLEACSVLQNTRCFEYTRCLEHARCSENDEFLNISYIRVNIFRVYSRLCFEASRACSSILSYSQLMYQSTLVHALGHTPSSVMEHARAATSLISTCVHYRKTWMGSEIGKREREKGNRKRENMNGNRNGGGNVFERMRGIWASNSIRHLAASVCLFLK